MNEEKTIEELQAELQALKKANLEREIAKEKAKKEEEEKLLKEKAEQEKREEIRQELLKEFEAQGISKISGDKKPEKMVTENAKAEKFNRIFKDKYGYGDKTYEQICEELMGGLGRI
jgi:hypothetical protein